MQNGHNRPYLGFWLKLVGVGAASAVVAAPLEASRGAFSAARALQVPPAAQTGALVYPRMPTDMEARLAEAVDPTPGPMTRAPGELFTDRAGLGEPAGASGGASVDARPFRVGMPGAGLAEPELETMSTAAEDTFETRLAARREALERGQTPAPMSTLYRLREVRPVGVIGAGSERDALLYAEPSRETFAAKPGARFYDGELASVEERGVRFRSQSGATRLVAWAQASGPAEKRAPPAPAPRRLRPMQGLSLEGAVRPRYERVPSESTAPPAAAVAPAAKNAAEGDARQLKNNHAARDPAEASASSQLEESSVVAAVEPTPPAAASPVATPQESRPGEPAAPSRTGAAAKGHLSAKADPPGGDPGAKALSFCDSGFQSTLYTVEVLGSITVGALLNDLHYRFGVNFMPEAEVIDLPAPLTVSGMPWGEVLRTILDYNDLDAVCTGSGGVRIAKRGKIAQIREARRKSEAVYTRLYKLRYLQTNSIGQVDLAGRVQHNRGSTVAALETAIRDILRASGDPRAEVRQVPGRNEFFVAATDEQHKEIESLIEQADQPPSQVYLSANVYVITESQSERLGSEFGALAGRGNNQTLGGISTFAPPVAPTSGTGATTGTQTPLSGRNPGGVPILGQGFLPPSGTLAAVNPVVALGVSSIIGTSQFVSQFTAAKQSGLLYEQFNPVGIIADGETFTLDSGTQIPIIIPALVSGNVFGGGAIPGQTNTGINGNVVFVQAGRIASITPQVSAGPDGKADYVTLQLRLENNSVDTSLTAFQGSAPPVNRQSIQTVVRLRDNQTVVIGGFRLDSDTVNRTKVPGLSGLPALGHLFKNRSRQNSLAKLYYSISVRVIPQEEPADRIQLPRDIRTREQARPGLP